MSQILSRALLLACVAGASIARADDSAVQPDLAPPNAPDNSASPADEAQNADDEGTGEEPARLQQGTEYYNNAGQAYAQGGQANLFYNFYALPGVPAGMYPAPYPTPANIGHVYYTYQPFLPHEFLYPHFRRYYSYHGNYHGYGNCRGNATHNVTTVRWARGHAPLPWYPAHPRGGPLLPPIPPCGMHHP